jgi:hypothetical protein
MFFVALCLIIAAAPGYAREFRTADAHPRDSAAVQTLNDMDQWIAGRTGDRRRSKFVTGLAAHFAVRAENNRPSFVTADHHKCAGSHALAARTMSPEVLLISHLRRADRTHSQGGVTRG